IVNLWMNGALPQNGFLSCYDRSSSRSLCSAASDGTNSTTAAPCIGIVAAMKSSVCQYALLLMAFIVSVKPALAARSYLNCLTKKVIIVDAPTGSSSSSTEENVGFWIEEATKIITLADGTPLIVRRFDDRWISATDGDVSYEIDRQNDILS